MGPEALLNWASELGAGSLEQWRSAASWAIPGLERKEANRLLAALSALAHAEVDWDEGRWEVVRPALTLLPNAGGRAFLTGGRTARFRAELEQELDEEIGAVIEFRRQREGPDSCYVAADSEADLALLADSFEIDYSFNVPARLEPILPTIGTLLGGRESVRGRPDLGLERFDTEKMCFVTSFSDRDPGLYRYENPGRRDLRWIDPGGEVYNVDRSLGTHAEIWRSGSAKPAIQWWRRGANGDLGVMKGTPLPLLHARAATLCSGRAPRPQGSVLLYPNVPVSLGKRIASTLGQSLKIQRAI